MVTDYTPRAYCWDEHTNTALNPHMFPMEILTSSAVTVTNYGKTYSVGNLTAALAALASLPVGRRCLRFPGWIHSYIFQNADDRCQDADGTFASLSTKPTTSDYWYRGGNSAVDGLPNGYSNVFLDHFTSGVVAAVSTIAAAIHAANLTVDFLAFDVEARITATKSGYGGLRTAITTDPRWPTHQVRLDAILGATFDTEAWVASHPLALDNAWNAYMWERQSVALNAIIAAFQVHFPACRGSNYEHHGRSKSLVDASALDQTGLTDINGNGSYQTTVTGGLSSDYAYGAMNQMEAGVFNFRARSHWGSTGARAAGSTIGHPYHALIWELRRSVASIQSGFPVMSWTAWMGTDDSDFALGGFGGAGATDKCPYWEANLAAQALLAGGQILHWNSRTYATENEIDVDGVDQAAKTFAVNGDWVWRLRPGLMQSFKIRGSSGNGGLYTVNRIHYTAGVTHVVVNEAIPSSLSDGKFDQLPTDANDALVNAVLSDLAAQMDGFTAPVVARPTNVVPTEYDPATGLEHYPKGSPITWVVGEQGTRSIYCVIIGRSGTDKNAWAAQNVAVQVNGATVEVFTVPASRAYAYCHRNFDAAEVVTFAWAQGAATNLLPSNEILDGAFWTHELSSAPTSIAASSDHLSPISGLQSVLLLRARATIEFPVIPGKSYLASIPAWSDVVSQSNNLQVYKGSDGSSSIAQINGQYAGKGAWVQYYCNFVAPEGETECILAVGQTNYSSWYGEPQVVQGILPGPLVADAEIIVPPSPPLADDRWMFRALWPFRTFSRHPGEEGSLAFFEIDPSDTVSFPTPISRLYVGGAGDVSIVGPDGSEAILKNMQPGTMFEIAISQVKADGTTAGNLVGFY